MSSFSEGQTHQLMDALEGASFTAGDVTRLGQFKYLGGLRGVLFGTHEIKPVVHRWREQDEVIYFSVTSDGTTGEEWIKRLEKKSFRVSGYAKSVLRSPDFQSTKGVTTEVAVLKGGLFKNQDCITQNIRAGADKRKLTKPNAEVACLIRENFSDEDIEAMGLFWVVAMHEPIKNSVGAPSLLDAYRGVGGRWLNADCGEPGRGWGREYGFAFALSPAGGGQAR